MSDAGTVVAVVGSAEVEEWGNIVPYDRED